MKRISTSPTTVLEDGDVVAALNHEESTGVSAGAAAGGTKASAAARGSGTLGAAKAAAAKVGAKDVKVEADAAAVGKGKGAGAGTGNTVGAGTGNTVGAAAAAAKQKPQARSTQQWKAAEQRGRRLAIKPHTAVQSQNPGANNPRMQGMGYWSPAPGQQGGASSDCLPKVYPVLIARPLRRCSWLLKPAGPIA